MRARYQGLSILVGLVIILLGACGAQPTPTPSATPPDVSTPTETRPVSETPAHPTEPPPTEPVVERTDTPAPLLPTATAELTPSFPQAGCRLGTGLREQTVQTLLLYKDQPALVMSPTYGMAEIHFPELEGWIRVLGAPSLDVLEQKAEQAEKSGLQYDGLGYGLETSKTTPDAEWQDLVGSTQRAREIADRYGKLLVMGPGLRLMSQNEDKYPGMAALSDVWIFQTQRYQLNPPGPDYRKEVERVVTLLRSANPEIQIWAQIIVPPDREPNADEWLAYRAAIDDLVDGTYLGIYTWKKADPDVLIATAVEVYAGACGGEP